MGWTDEQVEDLKRLWNEGLTTGEIGKVLGVSKNAVVGKAHRLGLNSRPSPIRRAEDDPAQESLPLEVKEKPKKTPKKAEAPKQKLFTVNDLTSSSCRWPIGDPKDGDFHFCGKEAIPGKPYCPEHAAVAYVSAKSVR